MLEIKNLHVSVDDKEIIKGLSLTIKPGQVDVIMGPNGSGKSTLSHSLIGHPRYKVTSGDIKLDGQSLLKLSPDKRAKAGLFLAWQQPRAIEGVRLLTFLKASYEAIQKFRDPNFQPLLMIRFRELLLNKMKPLLIEEDFINRYLNQGFSGGEKKKMEILQLALLEPKYAVMDEIDSGLDIDALKIVSQGLNSLCSP